MKLTNLKPLCFALAAGLALLGSPNKTVAGPLDDTVSYTNNFDGTGNTGTASWIYWYGAGAPGNSSMAWDSTMDANTNASSGSLVYDATLPQYDQQAWFGTFNNNYGYDTGGTHDPTKYTNIVVYVRVDPSSVLSTAGTYGDLQFSFYGQNEIGRQTIPASASNTWVRLVQPFTPAQAALYGNVSGIAFRFQTYDTYNNPVGHVKMWMDKLQFNVSPVPVLPPTLAAPTKPNAGLNLFSGPGNGDQYQRTSIQLRTHTGLSWIGQHNVTYSFTVAQFPGNAYSGYQAHLFIMPGNPIPSYETAPDYNEPHLIWLNVQNNNDGTATANLRYKIYETNSNANIFGSEVTGAPGTAWAGQIASLSAATSVGTWGLTFDNDTNVTINGPGGVSTTVNLHPEVAALFTDPLNVVLGAQPNNSGSVGQSVVIGSASITNAGAATSVLYDNFLADTNLSDPTWSLLTGDPQMVQVFGSDPGQQLVKWNLPDTGFSLQTSTNLGNSAAWTDLSGLTTFVGSGKRSALVPSASLNPKASFFRLIKRNFTQLQVLFPGETNAPNTLTGKGGTPTPVNTGDLVTVTVNAVDSTWHVINGISDTVTLSSTDTSAFLPNPAALVNGTQQQSIIFNSGGNWTVTADDTSDNTKTSNTSSPITVNSGS